jgi:hypothetical protein
MMSTDELRKENKEIMDLCGVLSVLVKYADMHENAVFCELLDRFRHRVDVHLANEDRSVFRELLGQQDQHAHNIAADFLSNGRELKKIFGSYKNQWCRAGQPPALDDQAFVADTKEMFRLVCERVDMEDKKLFPLLAHTDT